MKPLKHRYSGKESRKFWRYVNSLDDDVHDEIYSLGVMLQNIESFVLKRIKEEAPKFVENDKN